MSFPSFNDLSRFLSSQADELQQFIAYLQGFLSAQHKDDGSHSDVTADSVVVVGSISVGSISERGRSTPMGEWIAVPFDANNFTAGGSMTWTVTSGEQITYAYMLVGKTMTLSFLLQTTTVGGTASFNLNLAIPSGFMPAKQMHNLCFAQDNGADVVARCEAIPNTTAIVLARLDGTKWALSATNTTLAGQLVFEVA